MFACLCFAALGALLAVVTKCRFHTTCGNVPCFVVLDNFEQGLVKTFAKVCKAAVDKKSLPTHPVAAVAAGDMGVSRAAEHGPGGGLVLGPQIAGQCEVEEGYCHFREHLVADFRVIAEAAEKETNLIRKAEGWKEAVKATRRYWVSEWGNNLDGVFDDALSGLIGPEVLDYLRKVAEE